MPSRRDLLASASSSLALLSGCICVGATSVIRADDVIRIDVTRAERTTTGWRLRIELAQPGPEGWRWEDGERTEFPTSYQDVTLRPFAIDGTELGTVEYGDFEPGTVTAREVETTEFPDVLWGRAGDFENDADCGRPLMGVEVTSYVGEHESKETIPDSFEPMYNRQARRDVDESIHRWEPMDYVPAGESTAGVYEPFERTECRQRLVAGHEPTGQFFGRVDQRPELLERSNRFKFVGYPEPPSDWSGGSDIVSAEDVPVEVFDSGPPFEWAPEDGEEDRFNRDITEETFASLFEALDRRPSPSLSSGRIAHVEREHWNLSTPSRECLEATFRARYDFQYRDGRRLIELQHSWEPTSRLTGAGTTITTTQATNSDAK